MSEKIKVTTLTESVNKLTARIQGNRSAGETRSIEKPSARVTPNSTTKK